MLPTSLTTSELRQVTGLSKPGLVDLEQRGINRRAAKDTWLIPDTLVRLVGHFRDRGAHRSAADEQWRLARAQGQELRNQERLGQLAPTSYLEEILDDCMGRLRSEFAALPAMHGRDLAERRRLDDLLRSCLERLADHFVKKADDLKRRAIHAANRGRAA